MENKMWFYVGSAILVLLLIGSIIIGLGVLNGNTAKSTDSKQINPGLEKYRTDDIPEDCRLPEYESNPESWKQHLSHHQNTLYCLDYYEDAGDWET